MIDLKIPFPRVFLLLIGAIGGVVIASAVFVATGYTIFGGAPERPSSPADANNAELTTLAYGVLGFIKEGDYTALSQIAHPDYGVVFSPYATVTVSTNKRFSSEQIDEFGTDTKTYVWGVFDGSGEPIEMTPIDYFAEFVIPRDYCADATIIGIDRIVRSGNALENMLDEFPGLRFVDFHIPGGEKDSPDDLNWSSLRLGFEEHEGKLWLSLILHSTWTI